MTVVSFVIVGVSYIVVGNIVKSDMSGEIFFIWVCNMSIIGLSRLITAQLIRCMSSTFTLNFLTVRLTDI